MTPDDFINEAKVPPRRREGWGGPAMKQFVWMAHWDVATIVWAASREEAYDIVLGLVADDLGVGRDEAEVHAELGMAANHEIFEVAGTVGES